MKVIAMDAGQTGIRAQLRINGRVAREIESGGVMTDRPVVPQLAVVVSAVRPDPGTVLAVGSSGLGEGVTADELLASVQSLGVNRVLLTHDSVTSYLGALGAEVGVVVASGTGVVTLAVGEECLARVDGWGYLLGDAGSGFWIGRAGLDAVMRAHDGRGPATALSEIVNADFPEIENAYLELQADQRRVSRIASYARVIAGLAASDDVCARICRRAAAELASSAITGLVRVGQADRLDPAVSTVGKVFQSDIIATEFARLLTERFPQVRLIPAAGSGLDGAARLAELSPRSALWRRISSA